jgi:hypothetical protein
MLCRFLPTAFPAIDGVYSALDRNRLSALSARPIVCHQFFEHRHHPRCSMRFISPRPNFSKCLNAAVVIELKMQCIWIWTRHLISPCHRRVNYMIFHIAGFEFYDTWLRASWGWMSQRSACLAFQIRRLDQPSAQLICTMPTSAPA